jgi:hypothetical protein
MRLATKKRLEQVAGNFLQILGWSAITVLVTYAALIDLFISTPKQEKAVEGSSISCTIPLSMMAMRPGGDSRWAVMIIKTEHVFRSEDLCTAVQEANHRLGELEAKSRKVSR